MSVQAEDFWNVFNEANKSRARVYVQFYRAIERRLGHTVAVEICKEAIYNWGRELASGLEAHHPSDFDGLASSFAFAPDGGAMFRPRSIVVTKTGLMCNLRLAH